MWIVYENEWTSGGSFSVDEKGHGRLVVRKQPGKETDPGRFLGFAVTLEPAAGVTERTGAMVLASAMR
jgi:hypothetical protein